MTDPWQEILLEAIGAHSIQPVVGTSFRKSVDSAALKRGLHFPPPGEHDLRFVELLERYPAIVSIMRRPGQDLLVASAGRSDLLAKGIQERLYGIRRDLFEAFTTISDDHPFYDKIADRVVWKKPGEASDSLVSIEPATQVAEIQIRRDFAETVPDARAQLLQALNDPRPLQSFATRVRQALLQKKWHSFRTEKIVEKLQQWARDKKIEWKDAWLTEGGAGFVRTTRRSNAETTRRVEGDPLHLLFSGLDAADIQRISIPLDLVLKAFSSRRKP